MSRLSAHSRYPGASILRPHAGVDHLAEMAHAAGGSVPRNVRRTSVDTVLCATDQLTRSATSRRSPTGASPQGCLRLVIFHDATADRIFPALEW